MEVCVMQPRKLHGVPQDAYIDRKKDNIIFMLFKAPYFCFPAYRSHIKITLLNTLQLSLNFFHVFF